MNSNPRLSAAPQEHHPFRFFRFTNLRAVIFPTTLFVLSVLVQTAIALDITTTEGQTYKQCSVTRIEPDALNITHADGIARIPYEKLLPSVQKQFFDPAKVAAYRLQAEQAQKAAAEQQRIRMEQAREAAAEQQRIRMEAAAKAAQVERELITERERQSESRRDAAKAKAKSEATIAGVAMIALIGAGLFFYFLPTIVGRRKQNAGAIFVLNLCLGWSFIGWVVALVWACSKDSQNRG